MRLFHGRRTNIVPPLRAIVPWLARYFWYALVLYYPRAFFCLQIFYALQCLMFPLRIEANQYLRSHHSASSLWQTSRAVLYYGVLLIVGAAVHLAPDMAKVVGDSRLQLAAPVAES